MELIMKTIFGSNLYGTNTPESDTDYKGVFIPSKEDILLGRIPKTITHNSKKDTTIKNSKDDIDIELYSLHYFIKLACTGDGIALEMLNTQPEISHPIWDALLSNKHKFYTKNPKAFLGYAKKQVYMYLHKGERYNILAKIIKFLESKVRYGNHRIRLSIIWDELPVNKYAEKYSNMYVVCGRKLENTVSVEYALNVLNSVYLKYGSRVKQNAEAIDWKAMSHSIRVLSQTEELFRDKKITFPLKNAEFIKDIKLGKYSVEYIMNVFEDKIAVCEELVKESDFPEESDIEFGDNFIITNISKHVFNK